MPFEAPEHFPPPPRRRSRKEAQIIRIPKRKDAPAEEPAIEVTDADLLSDEEARRAHDEAESNALLARLPKPRAEDPGATVTIEPKTGKRKKSAASKEAAELAALRAEFKDERREIAVQTKAQEKTERKTTTRKERAPKPPAKKAFEEMDADERMALSPDELLAMAEEAPPAERPGSTAWIDARHREINARKESGNAASPTPPLTDWAKAQLQKMADEGRRKESEAAAKKARQDSMRRFTEQETDWMNEGKKMSEANERAHDELEARGGNPPRQEVIYAEDVEPHLDQVAELGASIDMDKYAKLARRQASLEDAIVHKRTSWVRRQKFKFELWAVTRELEAFEQEIDIELSARRAERLDSGETQLSAHQLRQMFRRESRSAGNGSNRGSGLIGTIKR